MSFVEHAKLYFKLFVVYQHLSTDPVDGIARKYDVVVYAVCYASTLQFTFDCFGSNLKSCIIVVICFSGYIAYVFVAAMPVVLFSKSTCPFQFCSLQFRCKLCFRQ
jgi:hypothetical protein